MANGMFKTKIAVNRHGPRLMHNNCKNFNPSPFSLPTTFNGFHKEAKMFTLNEDKFVKVFKGNGTDICKFLKFSLKLP